MHRPFSKNHHTKKFKEVFKDVVNKHAPIKTKMLGHNDTPFMTKNVRNDIIKRSKLKLLKLKPLKEN